MKLKASAILEAVVSVAMISALMIIIFPFFGEVLHNNHRMEIMRGLKILNEIEQKNEPLNNLTEPAVISEDGITVQQTIKQDKEIPRLYHVTTEMINAEKKVVYSFTEWKYLYE